MDFQKHFYTVGDICFGKLVKQKSEHTSHLFFKWKLDRKYRRKE